VLNHVGLAIRRIPSPSAETLSLSRTGRGRDDQDLLAADLRAELAATQEGKK